MTMLSINTNVGAMRSADASYSVNKSMETSMNRLSSGKRINGAGDDAGGIQIANRMNTEIMGLKQAVKNASDAQAFLMTAEGALEEVHTILLRIRELSFVVVVVFEHPVILSKTVTSILMGLDIEGN